MKDIILATTNPNKIKKLRQIAAPHFDTVTPQSTAFDVEETEDNFIGNAELKARVISDHYNTYAIASDGGVIIPALGEKWNAVLTKRFLGKDDVTDIDRIEGLLALMKGKEGDERKIIWREAIAIAYKGTVLFSTEVNGDEGLLQHTYNPDQYAPGIWQCTLTCYPQFNNKNFFELNDEERKYSEISWNKLKKAVDEFMSDYQNG